MLVMSCRLRAVANVFIMVILIRTSSEAAPNSVTIGVILPDRLSGGAEVALQQTVAWLNENAPLLPRTRLVLDYVGTGRPGLRQRVCRFLRGPVVALMSLDNSCSIIREVQQLAQNFSVPFFVVNRFFCLKAAEEKNGLFLSKAEHLDLVSLVDQWVGATGKLGVTVVAAKQQPADRLPLLTGRLSRLAYELVPVDRTAGAVRRELRALLESPRPDADFLPAMWAFVLLEEPAHLAAALAEVDEAGLLTVASPWLVIIDGWTEDEPELPLPTDANVTLARRRLGGRLQTLLATLARRMDVQSLDAEQTFAAASVLALAESLDAGWRSGWLPEAAAVATDGCRPLAGRLQAAPRLAADIRTRLRSWDACLTCLAFELHASKYGRHSVTANGTSVRLLPAGHWNATWRLDIRLPDLFRDSHLIVCTLPWHGMVSYELDQTGALVNRSGLSFAILNTLAEEMGFTYSVVEPPDGQWGVLLADGSWTGLVRMLVDGEADVCGPFSHTPLRQTAVDNTLAFITDYYDLMAPKAKVDYGIFIYKDPFMPEVWLGILVTMIATSVLLYVINRASPYYEHCPGVNRSGGLFRPGYCFWYMYGATVNQGGDHLPGAVSARVVVGSYWLFTLICLATYSGNLIATLTVPRAAPLVRDAADMAANGELGWLTVAGTDLEQTIMNPVAGAGAHLAEMYRAGRGRFYPPSEDVLPLVKAGGRVLVASAQDIRFMVDDQMRQMLARQPNHSEPCELDIIPLHVKEINVVFGLQKRSPYKAPFDRYLRMMQESGLIHAWLRSFLPNASQCLPEGGQQRRLDTSRSGLSLAETQGAFWLLLAGLVAALTALLLEALACRRRRRLGRRRSRRRDNVELALALEAARDLTGHVAHVQGADVPGGYVTNANPGGYVTHAKGVDGADGYVTHVKKAEDMSKYLNSAKRSDLLPPIGVLQANGWEDGTSRQHGTTDSVVQHGQHQSQVNHH